jgi:hypothetical protein
LRITEGDSNEYSKKARKTTICYEDKGKIAMQYHKEKKTTKKASPNSYIF